MQTCEARDLVLRCARRRDAETWNLFRERYERCLTAGVRRTLARFEARISREEREDLLQEIYCRLLERDARGLTRCKGQVEGAVVLYLGRIAESVVVDYLRNRGAAKRGRRQLADLDDQPGRGLAEKVADPGRSPEDQLLWMERRQRCLETCRLILFDGKKAERDLEVFYLAVFEGFTSREICERIDHRMTPSAVDSLMHRLRRRFGGLGIELPRR